VATQPIEDLPDLRGATVVVTGASAGIGAAAARRLHRLGATVVPVGRSEVKTRAVADELGVAPELVDFADLNSVRELARRLLDRCERIDVLANNAGGTWTRRQLTVDGHEMTFQVNHLAPFLLTGLLRERLTASAARVITTSSGAHRFGRLDLGDLDSRRQYGSQRAYGTSKLANIVFTRELARQSLGSPLSATSYHPGFVRSEFSRDSKLAGTMAEHAIYRFAKTPEQGADTLAWLATAPATEWRSGGYYAKRRESGVSRQATDDLLARQLWQRSAQLVGLDPEPAIG
jgi:NAD(P)-dependent dehydrogenase (short-subunit alcohol dehydrogenase family)